MGRQKGCGKITSATDSDIGNHNKESTSFVVSRRKTDGGKAFFLLVRQISKFFPAEGKGVNQEGDVESWRRARQTDGRSGRRIADRHLMGDRVRVQSKKVSVKFSKS